MGEGYFQYIVYVAIKLFIIILIASHRRLPQDDSGLPQTPQRPCGRL